MENKVAKIPVASHGLHKHKYNYPWLSSINFGDVMPCYYNPLRKGEKDNLKGGVYSQLMPIMHNAFVTGRYQFKSVFVPYKFVWKWWYNFSEQTPVIDATGSVFIPGQYPSVRNDVLQNAIIANYCVADGTSTDYDIALLNPTGMTSTYYHLTDAGRRILRIIGALGEFPSFVVKDERYINILPLLCYFKAFIDYYFPNNYIGNSDYQVVNQFLEREQISYDGAISQFLAAIDICSRNYYASSVFDFGWDNPTTPNVLTTVPNVSISDPSEQNAGSPVLDNTVENTTFPDKTPAVTNSKGMTGFTKYVLDALTSVSLWAKRHQLSGARLLDRFLVSRGVNLSNDSARISYFLSQRSIEIQCSAVENNTDTYLGELAGRGMASTGNEPLAFDCNAEDDGIFLVIVSPLPDANYPILLDGFCIRQDYLDVYHSEFDKIGAAAVPSRIIAIGPNGAINQGQDPNKDGVFCFLNQYWDEIQERPRLLGDFILQSRGAQELSAYHTFRVLNSAISQAHSYSFVRMNDANQYQRLFNSSDQENLMLFVRWYGQQFKEKLPLGDSYNWDDDELNKKISVVVGGSQK